MRPVVFRTERLFASVWDAARDAPAAHAMYADPEVVCFVGGELSLGVGDQRAKLEALVARDARLGEPFGAFPLFTRDDETLVGVALIQPLRDGERRWIEDEIEIGWHLARPRWGCGYATEAGAALLARGFARLDVDVLYAVVDPDNTRSHAVARRVGMAPRGLTERYYGRTLALYAARRPPAP